MAIRQELKAKEHCVYRLHYHIVFVTKYRRKCLDAEMLAGFRAIAGRLCEQWHCTLVECNGEPDHVHLLMETEPATPLTRLINNMKTVSSRLLRRDHGAHLARFYRKPVLWSPSYCLITCGGAPLEIIKQYIQNQAGAD
jgi:putative transposase